MIWTDWPLSRVLVTFVSIAFLMIAVQVSLLHYRQNFRHWAQWVPVIATPIFAIVALAAVLVNQLWLVWLLTALFGVGVVAGVYGFVLHVEGVGVRVDGYRFNNFMVGPPIVFPLMIAAMSLLGLIALFWR